MDRKTDSEPQPPVEVEASRLGEDTLSALIESFVLREGTDYGSQEFSLQTKIEQVKKQIERGDVKIVFDPDTESVTLLTLHQWKKRTAPHS